MARDSVVARDSQEPAQRAAVDPRDEPSAGWGWHGGFPRAQLVAGWASVVILLTMLIGNHENHTEDVWLIGIAAIMAFGLVLHSVHRRRSWRR